MENRQREEGRLHLLSLGLAVFVRLGDLLSLDTFPLTGGTTTVEALWMGVPVISLHGPSFHERLSHSILSNAGLGEFSVATADEFRHAALALAQDSARRNELRRTMRERLAASPLGDGPGFAHDFYELVAQVVG